MRIGLLASTQAGKTAYLTGLFGILKQFNKDVDYAVNTRFTDEVQLRRLEDWFTLLRNEKDFEGTKDITLYDCIVSHHSFVKPHITSHKQEIKFEIIDFPGETLLGAGTGEDKKRVEMTKEALSLCDGFIVIVDGDAILKQDNVYEVEAILFSEKICNLLDDALEIRKKNQNEFIDPSGNAFVYGKVPIAFAVSKFDKLNALLFSGELKAGAMKAFVEKEFARITKEHKHEVITAIFPVHVWDSVKDKQGKRVNTGFQPRNLEKPFQFVMFCGLTNAFNEHKRRLERWSVLSESAKKEASSAWYAYEQRANMGFWKKIGRLGNGEDWTSESKWKADEASRVQKDNSFNEKVTRDHHNATLALSKWILSGELLDNLLSDDPQTRFYVNGLSPHELQECLKYRIQENQWKDKMQKAFA